MKKLGKLLILSCLMIVVIFGFSSCNTYSDGDKLIEFIKNNGELQSDGQYKIDLKFSDTASDFDYVLYNPSNSMVGVAHIYKSECWSEAARKKIITSYVEEYIYFVPGKPWEATAFHYNYFVSFTTLEKTSAKYNFKLDIQAFDRSNHKIDQTRAYVKDIVLIEGNYQDNMRNVIGKYLYTALERACTKHMIGGMPYIF